MSETIYHKEIELGKFDYFQHGRKDCPVTVEITLRQTDKGVELSMCGNVWNAIRTDIYSGGQNGEEIASLVKTAKVRRMCEVWRQYHLNGMNAGTPAQTEFVKAHRDDFSRLDFYTDACKALDAVGLLYDASVDRDNGPDQPRGYRYGSEWLYTELPDSIIAEVQTW